MQYIKYKIADNLIDKLNYVEIYRKSHMPGILETYENDPKFKFFLKSNEERELTLPLLQYVQK